MKMRKSAPANKKKSLAKKSSVKPEQVKMKRQTSNLKSRTGAETLNFKSETLTPSSFPIVANEKKVSAAFKDADAYIRNVFMQAPVSIVVYKGSSFVVDMINEKGLEMWGTTYKKALGKPLFEVSPELQQGMEKILRKVFMTGEPYIASEFPAQYLRNGKVYEGFFNFVLNPVRDLNGTIVGITSIGTDVTEEIAARKKLEESETLFRFIANAMPQKVWTADASGNRTFFNKQWLDYTGMSLEELQNEGWEKTIHPDDLPRTIKRWKQAIETGNDFEVEDRKRDKNGLYKWHLSRASAFRDETGRIKMWVGTNTEVEKQKMQALEFENAVKERTKELAEQKEFSETIINTTIDLIGVYDKEMHIIGFNKACEDLFKLKKEDVIGKIYTDVFPAAKNGQGDKDLQRALNGETIHNAIYQSAVTGKYYENFITPLRDAAGKVYAAVAIAHDITDSINAIEKIKQSEEKFSKLFESSPFSITLAEIPSGKIIDVNENYIKLTGYNREELIGRTSLELNLIEKESRDKILEQLTERGTLKNAEVEIRVKSGKIIPILISIETITIGRQKYFLNAINDISERKKAEKELSEKNQSLEESESRIQTIFEAAPDAVIIINHDGIIINWNAEAENIFGWEKKEVIGRTLAEIIIPERYREQHKNGLKNFIRTGEGKVIGKPIEIEALKKDNMEIPVELKISASVVNHNPPVFIGFVRDISKRRQAENTLNKKTTELIEANANLKKMNKELESFTYISSHDLQEPLRKIQTFTGRILEKENQNLSDTGKDYFHRMQDASQRMQTLLQDLLSFSRVNTAERKFEVTDLNKIIEEVKTEYKEIIEQKQAIIEVGPLCDANVIPFQMRQMFHNLISNALKFSKPEVPPHITITARNIKFSKPDNAQLQPEKEYCHIIITDNGIGFEPNFAEKIFEVFQKLHGKDEYAGTGIGLAIVKKIVENHNGVITASSEPNKGATFDIYIPAE